MRNLFLKKLTQSLVLTLFLFSGNARAAEYILSPVLAFVPGYGVGHFVEGRGERGLTFLALDALATIAYAATFASVFESDSASEAANSLGTAMIVGVAVIGIRIWEVVDVVNGP